MNKRKDYNLAFYYFNIIFLLLFFVQAFDFPNKFTMVCAGSSCIIYVILQKYITFNLREILLFLSMFLYTTISKKTINVMMTVTLLPLLFFVLGKCILGLIFKLENHWEKIAIAIAVLVLGYFVHGFLNSILFFKEAEIFVTRGWKDIWIQTALPATAHELLFLPVLSLFFPALIYLKTYKCLCFGILLASFYGLFFSFISSSRTPFVVFLIVLLEQIFLCVLFNRKNKKIMNIVKRSGVVFIVLFCIVILFIGLNWSHMQNSFLIKVLNRDGGILGNIRFKAQYSVLTQMFKYPFGGNKVQMELTFAHNVWLDMANVSGIIPFFLFLGYTIFTGVDLAQLLVNKNVSCELKYVLSGLYISFILYYMVEPALEGNIQNILGWTYINGIIFALKGVGKLKQEREFKWNFSKN